jgi:hypothetical protein
MQEEKERRGRGSRCGRYPVLVFRAPPSLINLLKAAAARREVAYSVVVREALALYVGEQDEGRAA